MLLTFTVETFPLTVTELQTKDNEYIVKNIYNVICYLIFCLSLDCGVVILDVHFTVQFKSNSVYLYNYITM